MRDKFNSDERNIELLVYTGDTEKLSINPLLFTIRDFKDLYDYCKTSYPDEYKSWFIKWCGLIWFVSHPKSPYIKYNIMNVYDNSFIKPDDIDFSEDTIYYNVIKDVFPEKELFNKFIKNGLPKQVINCIICYSKLCETRSVRALRNVQASLDKINYFLEHLDLDERSKDNRLIHSVSNIMKSFSSVYDNITLLRKIEKEIEEELLDVKIRGNVELNEFNT